MGMFKFPCNTHEQAYIGTGLALPFSFFDIILAVVGNISFKIHIIKVENSSVQ